MSGVTGNAPKVSILIPASNEAALIGRCLNAVLASDGIKPPLEIIVISNGSHDETADIARGFSARLSDRGWQLNVLDLAQGGKMNALNRGDTAAQGNIRIYLDADVVVSPQLLAEIILKLDKQAPTYSSGNVVLARADSPVSRAYGRIYQRIPFMVTGVPGCGLFAVNKAGRTRWSDFPDIISDDTFVRLSFASSERVLAQAEYTWPLVEGFANLVRVRRRQDAGVKQLKHLHPGLFANDVTPKGGFGLMARLLLTDPFGFAVYASVALLVRLTPHRDHGKWVRGR